MPTLEQVFGYALFAGLGWQLASSFVTIVSGLITNAIFVRLYSRSPRAEEDNDDIEKFLK